MVTSCSMSVVTLVDGRKLLSKRWVKQVSSLVLTFNRASRSTEHTSWLGTLPTRLRRNASSKNSKIVKSTPLSRTSRLTSLVNGTLTKLCMTLVAKVFDFALPLLCSGGWFVTKLFQGVGVEELIEAVKPHFSYVRRFSPEASRNSSSEVYLVCRNHTPWNATSTSVLERYEKAVDRILGGDDVVDDVVATTTKFTVRRRNLNKL